MFDTCSVESHPCNCGVYIYNICYIYYIYYYDILLLLSLLLHMYICRYLPTCGEFKGCLAQNQPLFGTWMPSDSSSEHVGKEMR